jgi:3'-phosphoadenosine 5'-phosphosulfate sulfotransferase (PAPS reductase)/FAD synthetase
VKSDPFFVEGPALISFSGGRTSGYMLRRILDRGLEPDVHVLFCNTGKEDDRTLDFVRQCAVRWGVSIRLLQYRRRYLPKYRSEDVARTTERIRQHFDLHFEALPDGAEEPGFIEVDYDALARTDDPPDADHPFLNLIAMSGVPNATTRLCTTEMKIRVMKKFMLSCGYEAWTNVIGIRADEPARVAKLRVKPPERWENALPLADAGVDEQEVLSFWKHQPFDLGLAHDRELGTYEGNCDLCLLKSGDKKVRVAREKPESVDWWERVEAASGSFFRPTMPYREVRRLALLDAAPMRSEFSDLGDCFCHD